MRDIVATIKVCRQIGPEDFSMYHYSKVFSAKTNLIEIDEWVKTYGANLSFLDCQFSSKDE